MVLVELVLVLTMHKLALTLKVINDEISLRQMRVAELAMVALAILYACVYLGFDIY